MTLYMILQICTDACERDNAKLLEDMLTEMILADDEDEQEEE